MSSLFYGWLYDAVLTLVSATILVYIYSLYRWQYWKRKGVPIPFPPKFPAGHLTGGGINQPVSRMLRDIYDAAKDHKFVGLYLFTKPVLFVKDLDLTKSILIKDFQHFQDRGFTMNKNVEPVSDSSFFNPGGPVWKSRRAKTSPMFTAAKIRLMYQSIVQVGANLRIELAKAADEEDGVNITNLCSRYTSDVISFCALGLKVNSLGNPNNEFLRISNQMVRPTIFHNLAKLAIYSFPNIQKYIPIRAYPANVHEFFSKVLDDAMTYREKNNVRHDDLIQALMELKNRGKIGADSNFVNEAEKLTHSQATAEVIVLFIAGYETSASTLQSALYELALNQDLQSEARDEIDRVVAKYNGEITFDSTLEMSLLERIIMESMRKHSTSATIIRECTKDYKIPGTDVIIEKGTKVWMTAHGVHRDPKIYTDPDKFDPNRFLPEEIEKRHPLSFLAFGEGPRVCPGRRFGMSETVYGLATILSMYAVSPTKRTEIPITKFLPTSELLLPKNPIYLKITRREQ